MFTVLVDLQVRPERLEEFLERIHVHARASLRDEPGGLRFDVHQHSDDPHRFVLYEIYADQPAFYEAHRTTPHYAAWREVSTRCVVPGRHVNTFAAPAFPADIPENPDQNPTNRETA